MYRVGVDLGGTNIVAGVINEKMEIIGKGKLKTTTHASTIYICDCWNRKVFKFIEDFMNFHQSFINFFFIF